MKPPLFPRLDDGPDRHEGRVSIRVSRYRVTAWKLPSFNIRRKGTRRPVGQPAQAIGGHVVSFSGQTGIRPLNPT